MTHLPEPFAFPDDVEFQVTDALVNLVPIVGNDGWVREVTATFTNRAVLRMTLAQPFADEDDGLLISESSVGPRRC
jgi:hypothetical protein